MYCGCKMNWALLCLSGCVFCNTKVNISQPLSLQLDCNQGDHSVVKTTELFLLCTSAASVLVN